MKSKKQKPKKTSKRAAKKVTARAGRPATGRKTYLVRITPETNYKLRALFGSLSNALDAYLDELSERETQEPTRHED